MNLPIDCILDEKAAKVHTAAPDEIVVAAVRLMNAASIGALPVLENGRLVGIFTERDVLVRIIDAKRDPTSIRVREVMTPDPICISRTATVVDAMLLVTENHCRHLPVVEGNRLVGLISVGDLIRWAVRDKDDRLDSMLRAMRVIASEN
jgi:CBS domain-containing protein